MTLIDIGNLLMLVNSSVNYYIYKFLEWKENQRKARSQEMERKISNQAKFYTDSNISTKEQFLPSSNHQVA